MPQAPQNPISPFEATLSTEDDTADVSVDDETVQMDPSDPFANASQAFHSGDYSQTVAILTQTLTPLPPEMRLLLARAYANLGLSAQSIRTTARALLQCDPYPFAVETYLLLSKQLWASSKPADALLTAQKARDLCNNAYHRAWVQQIEAANPDPPAYDLGTLLQKLAADPYTGQEIDLGIHQNISNAQIQMRVSQNPAAMPIAHNLPHLPESHHDDDKTIDVQAMTQSMETSATASLESDSVDEEDLDETIANLPEDLQLGDGSALQDDETVTLKSKDAGTEQPVPRFEALATPDELDTTASVNTLSMEDTTGSTLDSSLGQPLPQTPGLALQTLPKAQKLLQAQAQLLEEPLNPSEFGPNPSIFQTNPEPSAHPDRKASGKLPGLPQTLNQLPRPSTGLPPNLNQMPPSTPGLPQTLNQLPKQPTGLPQTLNQLPKQPTGLPRVQTNLPPQSAGLPRVQTNLPPQSVGSLPVCEGRRPQSQEPSVFNPLLKNNTRISAAKKQKSRSNLKIYVLLAAVALFVFTILICGLSLYRARLSIAQQTSKARAAFQTGRYAGHKEALQILESSENQPGFWAQMGDRTARFFGNRGLKALYADQTALNMRIRAEMRAIYCDQQIEQLPKDAPMLDATYSHLLLQIDSGELHQAEVYLQALPKETADLPDMIALKARLAEREGHLKEAQLWAKKAASLAKDDRSFARYAAFLAAEAQDPEAMMLLQQLIAQNPMEHQPEQILLSRLQIRLKQQPEMAQATLQTLLQNHKDLSPIEQALAQEALGMAYEQNQAFEKARDAYLLAYKACPRKAFEAQAKRDLRPMQEAAPEPEAPAP